MNAAPSASVRNSLARFLLGPAAGAPSPRVADAIARHEQMSEVVICVIQLAGVGAALAIYVASFGAFDVHHALEPTPFALAIYGALTLARLLMARRGAVPKAVKYWASVLDVAVLIILIGSFPFQYGEPPGLYLKAPTLLYVFALIGLRALSFDPLQILFSGAVAAFGWSGLALLAYLDGSALTFNYPRYMTSFDLHPGAELEKISAILGFSFVLALGVERSKRLLARTAMEEAAARDLAKFVGADAAERIRASTHGVQSGDGELREAAILMVDLRGFTLAAARLAPTAVIDLLKDYQALIVPVVERHGGTVDKFLGDGVLVSFGAARVTGRECADALACALDILDAGARWRDQRIQAGVEPFDMVIAAASGSVVYGAVGFGNRLEYTVIGEAANLAAKLEKHAKIEAARLIASGDFASRAAAQGAPARPERRRVGAIVDGVGAPLELAIYA